MSPPALPLGAASAVAAKDVFFIHRSPSVTLYTTKAARHEGQNRKMESAAEFVSILWKSARRLVKLRPVPTADSPAYVKVSPSALISWHTPCVWLLLAPMVTPLAASAAASPNRQTRPTTFMRR